MLAVQLEALLDDLRSVGAAEEVRKPLADLLAGLRGLGAGQPPETEVTRWWLRSEQVLEAFAKGLPIPPDAPTRTEFWKG